jgi:hypothetical protein
MAEPSVQRAELPRLIRRFEALKQTRLARESEWQMIAEVFMPRKDFSIQGKPTDLRKRRLTSAVPPMALRRGAAFLTAYLIDNTRPFVKANAEMGLVAAGRSVDLDGESRDYLSGIEWGVFDRMMRPKSYFLSSIARWAMEYEAFGTGVLSCKRRRGFGPQYQCLPLRRCWIDVGEDGQVDTLFHEFPMRLWEAVERWPNHGSEDWTRRLARPGGDAEEVSIVCATYPRHGGRYGAAAPLKPFAEVYFCIEAKVILDEAGYDSFPHAVPRMDPEDGSPYGTGLGWQALPSALVLNALEQGIETSVELKNNPPLMVPQRMFGKALDRRAGAVNAYDAGKLGFMDADKAIQRLDVSGDVGVAADWLRRLEETVERGFLIDFMRLREAGTMTAEEVRERRELRIRSMAGFVPGVDRDLMGVLADRTLEVMGAEGLLPPPPAALSGVEVDWDYAGPLAIAQLKSQADSVSMAFDIALKGKALDENAPYVIAVEEGIRSVAEALGLPPEGLRSRATVEEERQRRQKAEMLAQNSQLAAQAAQALRDGGQGLNSLQAAGGQGMAA